MKKTLLQIFGGKVYALVVTGILVLATLAYAWVSAQVGVDYAATMLLISIMGGALVLILAIAFVFTVLVVAALIDRIIRVVRR